MGRIARVLEEAKPERRAALEHEAVAVRPPRTESGNDVAQSAFAIGKRLVKCVIP